MLGGVFGKQIAMNKRILLPSGLGLGFGVIMALPLAFAVQLSGTTFDAVNTPAFWLANMWTHDFGLPPRGEFAAWVVVPMLAVVVQWTLLGLLIGFSLSFRLLRARSTKSPGSVPNNRN